MSYLSLLLLMIVTTPGVPTDDSSDYQISEIHKSRLVQKRILCLDVEQARRAIIDESFEPYFSQLQRAEIAALTGAVPTEETLDGCRQQARQRFQQAVRPFTDREAETLSFLVKQIESRVQADYPLLAAQPWKFIKTANHHCQPMFMQQLEVANPPFGQPVAVDIEPELEVEHVINDPSATVSQAA